MSDYRRTTGLGLWAWTLCVALAALSPASARCGPAEEEGIIRGLIATCGRDAMELGQIDSFLEICTDDIVYAAKQRGIVRRFQGKKAVGGVLRESLKPGTASVMTFPKAKIAVTGDSALAVVEFAAPSRELGFIKGIMRWKKANGRWLCCEYAEADAELEIFTGRPELAIWPAQMGVGLPVDEESQSDVIGMAVDAAEQLAANRKMSWCNTRLIIINADGSGTTITAKLHMNTGAEPRLSTGYNTSWCREERVYDSKGNRLELRKWLRNPKAPGPYRVEIMFAKPIEPGQNETTFSVSKGNKILRRKGDSWVFQWRNYPGNACVDTCKVKFPASFKVVSVRPEPTDREDGAETKSFTWVTLVPRSRSVNNVITFTKP